MDAQTIAAYEADATRQAAYQRSVTPGPVHRLATAFFHIGEPTADVGCGSGRDTAWLVRQGFPTVGYEPATAMRAEALAAFPDLHVQAAALPDLAGVPDGTYANVLCNAVLMHLPAAELIGAAVTLARILRPGGRLVLSYRGPREGMEREPDGRLFTPIVLGRLVLLLESVGLAVLHREENPDAARPDVTWHALVAERGSLDVARGLERVQAVLAQDRKVATYKLALIRALCVIARTQSHLARWEGDRVAVPLWTIAIQWLISYWPLLTAPEFVAQIGGERPGAPKPMAFRAAVERLHDRHGSAGLYDLLAQLDANPALFQGELRVIADTIRAGPVTYAGGGATPLFAFVRPPRRPAPVEERFGWLSMPEQVWLDIARFDHWIEDSVVLRWARLTARMNRADETEAGRYLGMLLQAPEAEHTTAEDASFCALEARLPVCGRGPAQRAVPRRPRRALGCDPARGGWEDHALAGLQETVERLATARGLARWQP
jgi:SAM-dependent methyltransferase